MERLLSRDYSAYNMLSQIGKGYRLNEIKINLIEILLFHKPSLQHYFSNAQVTVCSIHL